MRDTLLKCLALAGELYNREITESMVLGWEAVIGHMEPDALQQQFMRHMRTSKWFPTPADILRGPPITDAEVAQMARRGESWDQARRRIEADQLHNTGGANVRVLK